MQQNTLKIILICIGVSALTTFFCVFAMYRFSLIRLFMPNGIFSSVPVSSLPQSLPPPPVEPIQTLATKVDICEADRKNFCPQAQDLVQIETCLDKNFSKLSSQCKPRYQKIRSNFSICEKDIQRHCKDSPYAGGLMVKCLRLRSKNLSEACRVSVGL